MNITVPLEIDDIVWVIRDRNTFERIITGVTQSKRQEKITTRYLIDNYGDQDTEDFEYFNSLKDAEIEIAKRILESLKDEE